MVTIMIQGDNQPELPLPIPRKPWNQTRDVHRGSTLITRVIT